MITLNLHSLFTDVLYIGIKNQTNLFMQMRLKLNKSVLICMLNKTKVKSHKQTVWNVCVIYYCLTTKHDRLV